MVLVAAREEGTAEMQSLRMLLRQYLERDPELDTAEFKGRTWRTRDMAAHVDAIEAILQSCGVPQGCSVGIIARNRIGLAAAMAGLLANGRCITMIYSQQPLSNIVSELGRLNLAAVIADEQDWTPELERALVDRVKIEVAHVPEVAPRLRSRPTQLPAAPRAFDQQMVEILTSGTTGPPKLIPFPIDALQRFVESATLGGAVKPPTSTLIYYPLGGLGGIMHMILTLASGAFFELHEKFEPDLWADAIRRHGIASLAVTPTMVRMILERGVPKESLASLQVVYGGAGDLEEELQQRFEDIYGVPLCWGYGATEFGGSLVSWTPALKREFSRSKAGSAGRILPGLAVRITDPETGTALDAGGKGRLEAWVPLVSDDWILTNDVASVDADGFVFIYGRLDGAINRGGFKIHPEAIAAAIRAHPSVRDAAVFGAKDARLGEVPWAAIELLGDQPTPSVAELDTFLRDALPAHSMPVRIEVLDALPRTQSLKVDLGRLREIYPEKAAATYR